MKENSRTIQEITGVCLEFYQKYGKIQNEQGESVPIKNIEDLKKLEVINKSAAKNTLEVLEVEKTFIYCQSVNLIVILITCKKRTL